MQYFAIFLNHKPSISVIRNRNFDTESRTLRKHNPLVPSEDTVEKHVEGLAEKIIAEDELRRAQELVYVRSLVDSVSTLTLSNSGHIQYCAEATELGFKT